MGRKNRESCFNRCHTSEPAEGASIRSEATFGGLSGSVDCAANVSEGRPSICLVLRAVRGLIDSSD